MAGTAAGSIDEYDTPTASYFKLTQVPTLDGYRDMLDSTLGLARLEQTYEYVAGNLASDLLLSPFWRALTTELVALDEREYQASELHVLAHPEQTAPEVVVKPFKSAVEKSFRRNYLHNRDWPEPPAGGWILPTEWYTRLRDVIRTTIVVKYLDGVKAVSSLVGQVCLGGASVSDVSQEARDEGYYAMHNVVCVPLPMPTDVPWEVRQVDIPVEVQVITQVQDVIRRLTHVFYEERRMRVLDPEKKWQWEWESPEFVPNYLGHILHYVDGAIMDVRRKQKAGHRDGDDDG